MFCFLVWFARFQILICEPQSIWRELLLLSWLYVDEAIIRNRATKMATLNLVKNLYNSIPWFYRLFNVYEGEFFWLHITKFYQFIHTFITQSHNQLSKLHNEDLGQRILWFLFFFLNKSLHVQESCPFRLICSSMMMMAIIQESNCWHYSVLA